MSDLSGVDRWRTAAFDLALEKGLSSLSMRALAQRVGGSASAVSYYFGSQAILMSELCASVVESSRECRANSLQKARLELSPWLDLAGAVTAILHERLETGRYLFALLREIEQEAMVSGWPEISKMIAADSEAEVAFWRDLAVQYRATNSQGALWADLATALTSMCLSLASPAHRSIWITAAVRRLHQRFQREPVRLAPDAVEHVVGMTVEPRLTNHTASRIVDAALAAIAEKGADRFNQREVASRAGVSLSAVTYFFGAKQELIATAFDEACRREYRAITKAQPGETGHEEIVLGLSTATNVPPMAAIQVLFRAALRHPDLREAANRMRALRGIGSLFRLRELGIEADRLDGYLWMTLVSGTYQRICHLLPSRQRELLQTSAPVRLNEMFGLNICM